MNLKAPSNTPIRSVTDEALIIRVYLDAGGERSITTSIITVYSSRRKEIKWRVQWFRNGSFFLSILNSIVNGLIFQLNEILIIAKYSFSWP